MSTRTKKLLTVLRSQINEKRPTKVKNFGIWIRYDSRSGTHNMYKEFREMSRVEAVEALYQDMAARHRARFGSIAVCFPLLSNVTRLEAAKSNIFSSNRSSRLSRSRTLRASVAPTSSSSSPRTSSSPCPTVPSSPLARRSSPTRGRLPLHKCNAGGSGNRSVWMNYDLAIACKDTKHAASNACVTTTTQKMGRMVFEVTLVLCSDGFKFISQKQNSGCFFSRFMTLEKNGIVHCFYKHVAYHDCKLCTSCF